jgi:hypothetical protein
MKLASAKTGWRHGSPQAAMALGLWRPETPAASIRRRRRAVKFDAARAGRRTIMRFSRTERMIEPMLVTIATRCQPVAPRQAVPAPVRPAPPDVRTEPNRPRPSTGTRHPHLSLSAEGHLSGAITTPFEKVPISTAALPLAYRRPGRYSRHEVPDVARPPATPEPNTPRAPALHRQPGRPARDGSPAARRRKPAVGRVPTGRAPASPGAANAHHRAAGTRLDDPRPSATPRGPPWPPVICSTARSSR